MWQQREHGQLNVYVVVAREWRTVGQLRWQSLSQRRVRASRGASTRCCLRFPRDQDTGSEPGELESGTGIWSNCWSTENKRIVVISPDCCRFPRSLQIPPRLLLSRFYRICFVLFSVSSTKSSPGQLSSSSTRECPVPAAVEVI